MICRTCHERPVSPGNLRARIYQCWKCRLPKIVGIKQRYLRTAKGQQLTARHNSKRVHLGSRYLYRAPTADHAAVVNAHIKRKCQAFRQRQQMEAYGAQ